MFKNQKTAVAKDAVLAERSVQGLIESFIIRGSEKQDHRFLFTFGVGNALDGIGMTDNGVSPCLCLFYIKRMSRRLSRLIKEDDFPCPPAPRFPALSFRAAKGIQNHSAGNGP